MNKKQIWKPGNMLYPVPAVMVSCGDAAGKKNIITVAWTGTICSDPAMVSISVRPERFSYSMIEETGEFVINLTTKELTFATDWCGVKSGRDVDKFAAMNLTAAKGHALDYAPIIEESPVNIECCVTEKKKLGSHDMFLAEIADVMVSEKYMNETGKFIWELLQENDMTVEEIANTLVEVYGLEKDKALESTVKFIEKLKNVNVFEDQGVTRKNAKNLLKVLF